MNNAPVAGMSGAGKREAAGKTPAASQTRISGPVHKAHCNITGQA